VPEEILRQYLFDRPGLYQIRVVGELDERWLAHLEGLEISTNPWRSYHLVTQITGWLADQTTLSGLLDLLNDLGRVILSVERQEQENDDGSTPEGRPLP
jgi:hypothetical protein